jgi:hypothetical protein
LNNIVHTAQIQQQDIESVLLFNKFRDRKGSKLEELIPGIKVKSVRSQTLEMECRMWNVPLHNVYRDAYSFSSEYDESKDVQIIEESADIAYDSYDDGICAPRCYGSMVFQSMVTSSCSILLFHVNVGLTVTQRDMKR